MIYSGIVLNSKANHLDELRK